MSISLFACWFQPELISQPTVFFSHNKPAPAGLISPETKDVLILLCTLIHDRVFFNFNFPKSKILK